jgi:hypothetical protein
VSLYFRNRTVANPSQDLAKCLISLADFIDEISLEPVFTSLLTRKI